LSALGDPTRLGIFRLLVEAGPEGRVVGQIIERLQVAPATLSFHLKTLHHAGLITSSKERQFVRYVANFAAMNGLVAYLTDQCCGGHPELCAPGACVSETDTRKIASHAA
jgi:DNA-binding transcriptional ArsR family regulator